MFLESLIENEVDVLVVYIGIFAMPFFFFDL